MGYKKEAYLNLPQGWQRCGGKSFGDKGTCLRQAKIWKEIWNNIGDDFRYEIFPYTAVRYIVAKRLKEEALK